MTKLLETMDLALKKRGLSITSKKCSIDESSISVCNDSKVISGQVRLLQKMCESMITVIDVVDEENAYFRGEI